MWKVKQAARPRDPHVRAAVAAEGRRQVRAARRHVDLPDEGREDRRRPRLDRLRRRPQLPRRHHLGPRPAAAVQDRTRWSRTSSRAASASPGAPRRCPGGGYWSMPKLSMPGAVLVGDAGGMVDTAALKGVHHCIKSGMLAAEAIYAVAEGRRRRSESYEQAVDDSSIGKELYQVAQHAAGVPEGVLRRQPAGGPVDHVQGQGAAGPPGVAPRRRRADVHRRHARSAIPSPTASTRSTSSPRCTSRATPPVTTRPTTSACSKQVPREIAETWRWMCPAGVYEIPDDAPETGPVDVIVNYTNCVQCGAITAKGGRLTPPEGGDGPAVPDHLTRRGCRPATRGPGNFSDTDVFKGYEARSPYRRSALLAIGADRGNRGRAPPPAARRSCARRSA